MCLRCQQQPRRKRERKEKVAEKKKSTEGTKRKEYHREVGIVIIVFPKDHLKI